MIKITLPDSSIKEFSNQINGFEIAKSISEKLLKDSIAIKVNEKFLDLSTNILEDSKIEILTSKNSESLEILRHTTEHILTQAIYRLYPKALAVVGPATETGFFF